MPATFQLRRLISERIWGKAAKQFAQHPGFSTVVLVTLALTIGIATAVFSLFDAVFLRSFPYPSAEQLVRVGTYWKGGPASGSGASIYDFWDWQRLNQDFVSLAAYVSFNNNLTDSRGTQVIRTTATSPELFKVLGIAPVLGRTFARSEDEYRGDVRKVVLSHTLCAQLFADQKNAVNRVIHLGGESYTVIGIMPVSFEYPAGTQAWIPLMAKYSANADPWWKLRDIRVHAVLGRLRPGVSLSSAQLNMNRVLSKLAEQYPTTNSGVQARIVGLQEAETGPVREYVVLVSWSVFLLLTVGCVNVAGLFIARASTRQREFAIRRTLGATTRSIAKQLVGESLLYGMIGSAVGTMLAYLGIRALTPLLPSELPAWMVLHVDRRVLLFSVATSLTTAVIFGFAPLIGRARIDLHETLRQGGKGGSEGKTLAIRLRRGLVIVEVAFSLLLLLGAGLMVRSFQTLMNINTGVKTDHLIVATVARYLPNSSPAEQVEAYSREYQRTYRRLATFPGVAATSAGDDIPYLDQPEKRSGAELFTKARPTFDLAYRGPAASSDVMPGFFKALGIPLLAGREFTDADTLNNSRVAIISEFTAQTFFPDRSAIGEQIRWGNNDTYNPWSTVIGVVGNTKWNPAERTPDIEVYWSALQYPPSQTNLLIRTTVPPQKLLPAVRRMIQEVSPNLAIVQSKTMDEIVDGTVWQHRIWSYVLSVFAGLALLLTAVGLYGVMSYLVSQSSRELGIRMAIGSPSTRVLALVLERGMRLVFFGLAAGLGGVFATRRLLRSFLFGVTETDPSTYTMVIAGLAAVTFLACLVPALRASRIDPLVALREE